LIVFATGSKAVSETVEFADLIRRVRRGDADAAAELVTQYESELRIIARVKLNDPRLRRVFDSMDVCQSILANFFVRASAGQFEIDTPGQLLKLLSTMIRNKVTDHARFQNAVRRDMGRTADVPFEDLSIAAEQDTPSQIVSARELAKQAHERFAADEREIVDRRGHGESWEEIAMAVGGSPEALRKKMSRAVDRVARELGLNDVAET
jgi:RNA polymerase sigma factor (sigma-70 family)